jgi:hypothetical protein
VGDSYANYSTLPCLPPEVSWNRLPSKHRVVGSSSLSVLWTDNKSEPEVPPSAPLPMTSADVVCLLCKQQTPAAARNLATSGGQGCMLLPVHPGCMHGCEVGCAQTSLTGCFHTIKTCLKFPGQSQAQWHMPTILAIWKIEIRKMVV